MKCSIPEISWHNREPVLSIHLHPVVTKFYKLVTGGADCHVIIWQLSINADGSVSQEVISDLTRHQRAVNSVRWSPNGQYLASADDDANIIIWQQKLESTVSLDGEMNDKEVWNVWKVLRGHKEDIYDLCWSCDGTRLLSGSVDNTAILWNINKGKLDHIVTDHKGFVQGVAWDPKNECIATIASDRFCRLIDVSGKHVKARIDKGMIQVDEDHYLYGKEVKYFHDDTFKSFYRRLQFSPDGSLLIVPSGHIEVEQCKKILNCTMIFTMDKSSPSALLPIPNQTSIVVGCCPILFELRLDGPEPYIKLPYRMIFAVGSDHDITLFDTQQIKPFARLHQIHYTRLTDLTWSQDGCLLIGSSTDGFCSLITFEPNELGVRYVEEIVNIDENVVDLCEKNDDKECVKNKENDKTKRSSFLEQWANKSAKKGTLGERNGDGIKQDDVSVINDDGNVDLKTPRRIVPITIATKCDSKEVVEEMKKKSTKKETKQSKKETELVCEKAKSAFIKIKLKEGEESAQKKKRITPTTISSPSMSKTEKKLTSLTVIDLEQNDGNVMDGTVTPKTKRKNKTETNQTAQSSKKMKSSLLDYFRKEKTVKTAAAVDESEARDAWNCDNDIKIGSDVVALDDDRTEDFTLKIEEDTVPECVESGKKVDIIKSEKSDGTMKVESVSKVPRRVALITLSSPKSKTKEKN